jgi:hypothetical protein
MINGQVDSIVADTIGYTITITKTTSINKLDLDKVKLCYNNNILMIDSEIIGLVNISITNLSGQIVKLCNSNSRSIDLNNISNGVYLITLKTKSEMITKKIYK